MNNAQSSHANQPIRVVVEGLQLAGRRTTIRSWARVAAVANKLPPPDLDPVPTQLAFRWPVSTHQQLPVEITYHLEPRAKWTDLEAYQVLAEQAQLRTADALVYVVDSRRLRAEQTRANLESLGEKVRTVGRELESLPVMIQCNQLDHQVSMTYAEVQDSLSWPAVAYARTNAASGEGLLFVFERVLLMAVTARLRRGSP